VVFGMLTSHFIFLPLMEVSMKSRESQDVGRGLKEPCIFILNIVRKMSYDESDVRDQWG
jgi:hypothetical protein